MEIFVVAMTPALSIGLGPYILGIVGLIGALIMLRGVGPL